MRFLALATDYDGTIAHHGHVNAATLAALERAREAGRKLILVTGRLRSDLARVFEPMELFDLMVVENGAVLYRPATREEKILTEPASPKLIARLRERGVAHLEIGQAIVATMQPYESVVLEAIRELGLEHQVIFNKGAVMVLPSGVNKATGLEAALAELGLSVHNVVGVGDAENDHAFLERCGCAVAVANALPALKERADWVMARDHGEGVQDMIAVLLRGEHDPAMPPLRRHQVLLGRDDRGRDIGYRAPAERLLVVGKSGGGKSTIAAGLFERLIESGYQALLIDPEGDHAGSDRAVVLGSAHKAPEPEEVVSALQAPHQTVVVNLIAVRAVDKPGYFQRLLGALQPLRLERGRPHCLVLDEVHHLLPAGPLDQAVRPLLESQGIVAVTTAAELVADRFLALVTMVVAASEPGEAIAEFCRRAGTAAPSRVPEARPGERMVVWHRGELNAFALSLVPPKVVTRRHVRKYAQGRLGEDESFYFEGPARKLHLRAENLLRFMELGEGVDDETWMHHLGRHDFSRWFRATIKDAELAAAAERIEDEASGPLSSRAAMRAEIERRYTVPG
ncbi:MAG TPA: HAD-IIB family hydrolase [Opitutaceae bacterium]|nr:HAD-IIB family hydrolase [Opitutaceae bacterium]